MPERSAVIYVRLAPELTGMFRFLLEARDNLALASTLERDTALLKVVYARESREQVLAALRDMSRSLELEYFELALNPKN